MAINNLNYHSYFSLSNGQPHDTFTSDEVAVFNSSQFDSGDVGAVTEGTPGFSLLTNGKIRCLVPGTYIIMYCVPLIVTGAFANAEAVTRLKKNGTTVFTQSGPAVFVRDDPKDSIGHVIVEIDRGDLIELTMEAVDADSIGVVRGAVINFIKLNGLYSNAHYTADADVQADDVYKIFDDEEGGTVATETNGVTYTSSNGQFSPDTTRKFIILSTQTMGVDVSLIDTLRHKIIVGGSDSEVVTFACRSSIDPFCHTVAYALEVANTSNVRIEVDDSASNGEDYTIKQGTCLSLIDVSNSGTDPGAFLSFTTTTTSNEFSTTSGEKDIFDQDNYPSSTLNKTDRLTASNITYSASNGRFTVSRPGDYLILLSLTISDATTTGHSSAQIKINKNDTLYYQKTFHTDSGHDPHGKFIPIIIRAEADDYFNFIVNNLGGKLNGDGQQITIIKLNNVAGSRRIRAQEEASTQIGDDFTINSFKADVFDKQFDRVENSKPPFSRGQLGPRNLRGRTTSYDVSLGGKTKK